MPRCCEVVSRNAAACCRVGLPGADVPLQLLVAAGDVRVGCGGAAGVCKAGSWCDGKGALEKASST